MARIGRPPGSGTGTSTAPGTCATCGRAKRWKPDPRRAAGGYWTCNHKDAGVPRGPRASGAPRTDTTPKPAARGATRRRTRQQVGTQEWLTNPAIPVCRAEACYWDSATCPTHALARKKN